MSKRNYELGTGGNERATLIYSLSDIEKHGELFMHLAEPSMTAMTGFGLRSKHGSKSMVAVAAPA